MESHCTSKQLRLFYLHLRKNSRLVMVKSKHVFSLLLSMLSVFVVQAQAEYDVRFVNQVACESDQVLIDVEVKAAAVGSEFHMSEQNYRFSFNKDALANPTIISQALTGFVPGGPGPLGFTLYSPHNLVGSLDTVVSYNVELQGGDGAFLTADTWVMVGQLGFDLLDPGACYDLIWHETAFPPTFVGELDTNERFDAIGITYAGAGACAPCVLPMEMISFQGVANNCVINLSWQTASETNTDYVMVQRSFNGVDFQDMGRVSSAGNSTTLQNYSYTDATVIAANNYYRLQQVDADGSYRYSEIIEVKTNCFKDSGVSDILDVYPNPVGDNVLNIRLYSSANEVVDMKIMDIFGKVVAQNSFDLNEGTNSLQFSPTELSAGTYFISIEGSNWHSVAQKIVKVSK